MGPVWDGSRVWSRESCESSGVTAGIKSKVCGGGVWSGLREQPGERFQVAHVVHCSVLLAGVVGASLHSYPVTHRTTVSVGKVVTLTAAPKNSCFRAVRFVEGSPQSTAVNTMNQNTHQHFALHFISRY